MALFRRKPTFPEDPPPPKALRIGFWRGTLLVILLLLVWLISMIVTVPAGWIWHQTERHLSLPPALEVRDVGGTLWSGTARVRWDGMPVHLGWTLDLRPVRHGFLPLEWRLSSGNSEAEGSLTATLERQVRILVRRGEFDVGELVRMSGVDQVGASGTAQIQGLLLVLTMDGWEEAEGYGVWPGGPVSWPMGGEIHRARLPAMEAEMALVSDDVRIQVRDQDTGQTGVTLTLLAAEPVLEMDIHRHWLDLLELRFGEGTDPEEVVFNVRQRLAP